MQIIQTCGLIVEYNNIQHNEYLFLKDKIEEFGKECVKLAKECNKIPFMRYIRVKKHYYLSCHVKDNQTELALYDSVNRILTQNFYSDSPVKITPELIDDLYVKMYQYSKTPGNPPIKYLQEAWDKLFLEKELQQERE